MHLRRIRFTGKTLVFLTNQTALLASAICDLYRTRWRWQSRQWQCNAKMTFLSLS